MNTDEGSNLNEEEGITSVDENPIVEKTSIVKLLQEILELTEHEQDVNKEEEGQEGDDDEDEDGERQLVTSLCLLWDLSSDQSVQDVLITLPTSSILLNLLNVTMDSRAQEIVFGIFANLVVNTKFKQVLDDSNYIKIILEHMFTNQDPLVLIQIIRLINTSASQEIQDNLLIKELFQADILNHFVFIILNTLNSDLLSSTLGCLSTLFWYYPQSFSKSQIKHIIDTIQTLFESTQNGNGIIPPELFQFLEYVTFSKNEDFREILLNEGEKLTTNTFTFIEKNIEEELDILPLSIALITIWIYQPPFEIPSQTKNDLINRILSNKKIVKLVLNYFEEIEDERYFHSWISLFEDLVNRMSSSQIDSLIKIFEDVIIDSFQTPFHYIQLKQFTSEIPRMKSLITNLKKLTPKSQKLQQIFQEMLQLPFFEQE